MRLRRFTTINLAGIYARDPVKLEEIKGYLQLFVVTDDMEGNFIDPTKLCPRADLHHGLTEPIPMDRIVTADQDALLRSMGFDPATVVKCGPNT